MFGSYERAMVDTAIEAADQQPDPLELVPGTRLCFDCKYEEMADHPWCGVRGCRCPHCLLRPVSAFDVETMADRMVQAAHELGASLAGNRDQAARSLRRRRVALRRLAYALERQAGGEPR